MVRLSALSKNYERATNSLDPWEGGNVMANKKHPDILKRGVEVWNEWRRKHPTIRPNLRRADLSEANLRRADLSKADLSKADLSKALQPHFLITAM